MMLGTTIPKSVVVEIDYIVVTFRDKAALKYTELDECGTALSQRVIDGVLVWSGPSIGRGDWKVQRVAIPEIGSGSPVSQLDRAVDLAMSVAYLVEGAPAWQCPTLLPFMGAICG
jgi:hypothetical protein